MSFAEEIELASGGEVIDSAVIGGMGWSSYGADKRHAPGLARQGEVPPWSVARPLLDYEYDTGYGAPDCQAVHAWTAYRVIFVSQYDGSTRVTWVPRHPTPGPV